MLGCSWQIHIDLCPKDGDENTPAMCQARKAGICGARLSAVGNLVSITAPSKGAAA